MKIKKYRILKDQFAGVSASPSLSPPLVAPQYPHEREVANLFQDLVDNGIFIEPKEPPKTWIELAQQLKHAMTISAEGEEIWKALIFGYLFHPELKPFFSVQEVADAITFVKDQKELLLDKSQLDAILVRFGYS